MPHTWHAPPGLLKPWMFRLWHVFASSCHSPADSWLQHGGKARGFSQTSLRNTSLAPYCKCGWMIIALSAKQGCKSQQAHLGRFQAFPQRPSHEYNLPRGERACSTLVRTGACSVVQRNKTELGWSCIEATGCSQTLCLSPHGVSPGPGLVSSMMQGLIYWAQKWKHTHPHFTER